MSETQELSRPDRSKREWRGLAAIDAVSKFAAVISGGVVLLMAVQVTVDVVMRAMSNRPLPGTLDIISLVYMPILITLSLGYAERAREHITVSLLPDSMGPAWRRRQELVVGVASAVAVWLLLYYGYFRAIQALEIRETSIGSIDVPVWPSTIVMTVGLAIFLLQVSATVFRAATVPLDENEKVTVSV
jgi:TRAP-type C4-dicarboxylate transport system permease small subunit